MVAAGVVPSLARPGGNITGVSILAPERLDILIELAPNARRIAALADPNSTASPRLQALRDAAQARGGELLIHMVDVPERIVPAIDEAKRMGAMALNVLASPILHLWRGDIIKRAAALHLPAIYQWVESAEEGGLIAYGPRIHQLYRQMARQLAKVLRGAKPGDLPVEQPTKFELVMNLKTAKELGITIPPTLIARADEVIE